MQTNKTKRNEQRQFSTEGNTITTTITTRTTTKKHKHKTTLIYITTKQKKNGGIYIYPLTNIIYYIFTHSLKSVIFFPF